MKKELITAKVKTKVKKIAFHIGSSILTVLALIAVIAIAAAGMKRFSYSMPEVPEESVSESILINDRMLASRMDEIGELGVYEYGYRGFRTIESTRRIGAFDIPGTRHQINLDYTGMVKVGYDVSDIVIHYDAPENTISVNLPEPSVLDNYIDMEHLVCSERNNVFNPISSVEVEEELKSILAAELERAEEKGIYRLAETNIQQVIRSLFSDLECHVVFK